MSSQIKSRQPRPWRRDPVLISYIGLTLWALIGLADWIAPQSDKLGCHIGHVYDGDTVDMVCGALHQTTRLTGFDTPETRDAGCPEEKALGDRATARLRGLIAAGHSFRFLDEGHDKYGRALVHLWIDGHDIAEVIISEGLATSYEGGARINWCDRIRG